MDACTNVEKEVDKVLLKFTEINKHGSQVLGELISNIENLKAELENAPEDLILTPIQSQILKDAMCKIKETVSRLGSDHRDIHGSVSKIGKAIERNFVSNFTYTSTGEDYFASPEKVHLVNQVIYQHFCQQGMQDVADALASEALIEVQFNSDPYKEVNQILDNIRNKDLGLALKWASIHRKELDGRGSALEFKLHRLVFIELLKKGLDFQTEAIYYAREHFPQFVSRHEDDIQKVMGLLLFLPHGMEASPYRDLLDTKLWMEIYEIFIRDACSILGINVESPLATCINAGCTAVPALLNIKQVMMKRHVGGVWNGKDELPIEIDLGADKRFHSMFACPILRQQSTESNPPMKLVCGHVISRDALNKLCNNNKLKCPYCPIEQNPADARLVFF